MGELVYQTLNHATTYFAFRMPRELGKYHWRIDGKDKLKPAFPRKAYGYERDSSIRIKAL